MDSSHVSLVGLLLKADGFGTLPYCATAQCPFSCAICAANDGVARVIRGPLASSRAFRALTHSSPPHIAESYRCDRNFSLGINLVSMSKILKCADNDDSVTLRCEEDKDTMTFVFESQNGSKLSEFELKLMEIEQDALGIPDTKYQSVVDMPSAEFQRICRDLTVLGDTVQIGVTKGAVKFHVSGELGTGDIVLKSGEGAADSAADASAVNIRCASAITLSFALRYLNCFAKATPLSDRVAVSVTEEVPLAVEYRFADAGYLRFYLGT